VEEGRRQKAEVRRQKEEGRNALALANFLIDDGKRSTFLTSPF
jgi:hypothetical protein